MVLMSGLAWFCGRNQANCALKIIYYPIVDWTQQSNGVLDIFGCSTFTFSRPCGLWKGIWKFWKRPNLAIFLSPASKINTFLPQKCVLFLFQHKAKIAPSYLNHLAQAGNQTTIKETKGIFGKGTIYFWHRKSASLSDWNEFSNASRGRPGRRSSPQSDVLPP